MRKLRHKEGPLVHVTHGELEPRFIWLQIPVCVVQFWAQGATWHSTTRQQVSELGGGGLAPMHCSQRRQPAPGLSPDLRPPRRCSEQGHRCPGETSTLGSRGRTPIPAFLSHVPMDRAPGERAATWSPPGASARGSWGCWHWRAAGNRQGSGVLLGCPLACFQAPGPRFHCCPAVALPTLLWRDPQSSTRVRISMAPQNHPSPWRPAARQGSGESCLRPRHPRKPSQHLEQALQRVDRRHEIPPDEAFRERQLC